MTPIEFTVVGVPVPQAGTRTVPTKGGNRQISTGGAGLKDWRSDLAAATRKAVGGNAPIEHAVTLEVEFRFPMPKSRTKTQRAHGVIPKTTTPDLDKLVRAVGDALKAGGAIVDDSLITNIIASKHEVVGWSGVTIRIDDLE